MTDTFTHELFYNKKDMLQQVVFPVSRLVIDPERFIDDDQEPMSKRGMGAVYTLTSTGSVLRKTLTDEDRELLLQRYYFPHHDALYQVVTQTLNLHKRCLIIDCHSFPSAPLPYEYDQSEVRPDICIGTDDFHTPQWLSNEVVSLFRKFGYSVELDRPFCGTLVPSQYYRMNPQILSIMIEINRKLYMDEKSGEKKQGYNVLHKHLAWVIQQIKAFTKH